MIISRNKGFIFASVGKTGTTSIESVLQKYEDTSPAVAYKKHAPFYEIETQYNLDDFFTFAFFRNPWDLMVSKYFFHRSARCPGYGGIPVNTNARKLPFKKWIQFPGHLYIQYEYPVKTMFDFVADKNHSRLLTDKIYKYEHLRDSFKEITGILGINEILPHFNRSHHKHYSLYYDKQGRDIVERTFKKEIELMGYTFQQEKDEYCK